MTAQQAEPVEDVRIAAKLPERAHAGMPGVEVVQKVTPSALIIVRRFGSEGSGERFGGPSENGGHRITRGRKSLSHDWTGGTGCRRRAAACAYCSTTSRGEI